MRTGMCDEGAAIDPPLRAVQLCQARVDQKREGGVWAPCPCPQLTSQSAAAAAATGRHQLAASSASAGAHASGGACCCSAAAAAMAGIDADTAAAAAGAAQDRISMQRPEQLHYKARFGVARALLGPLPYQHPPSCECGESRRRRRRCCVQCARCRFACIAAAGRGCRPLPLPVTMLRLVLSTTRQQGPPAADMARMPEAAESKITESQGYGTPPTGATRFGMNCYRY